MTDKAPELSPVERFHVVDLHPSVGVGSFMELDEFGDWVRASDYIALAARVDALTNERDAALVLLGAMQCELRSYSASDYSTSLRGIADDYENEPHEREAVIAAADLIDKLAAIISPVNDGEKK